MKSKRLSIAFSLSLLSVVIPLGSIAISAYLSNWFDLYHNALSDLGHATRSTVSPLFNLGLSLGGLLMSVFGAKYVISYSRLIGLLVALTGYLLILISVFDEVYGSLHFIVSILFFILLLLTMLIYVLMSRNKILILTAVILLSFNAFVWYTHIALKTPRGAALPELASVFTAVPFYLHLSWKIIYKGDR